MSKLIFSLRDVPPDEAEDIRQLLSEHHLTFYETSAGNWGISTPALWLVKEEEWHTARALIDEYQSQRQQLQRAAYLNAKQQGSQKRWIDILLERPIQLLLYTGFSAFILYISYRLLREVGF